jgi:formylglycine-generating enzyme required for sulfatase activity
MTHPVGGKFPNALGLYDMHGNVWEWVEDDWYPSYYGIPDDGKALEVHENWLSRMIRGGGYYSTAQQCRSAARDSSMVNSRHNFLGIRIVRSKYPNEPLRGGVFSY